MYRLYAQRREGGYENKIIYGETLEELKEIGNRLNPAKYYSYLIVKNEGKGDEPVGNFKLSEPVKVEIVDKIKTDIKVDITEFGTDGKTFKAKKLAERDIDR
jgi:hypothetical protein